MTRTNVHTIQAPSWSWAAWDGPVATSITFWGPATTLCKGARFIKSAIIPDNWAESPTPSLYLRSIITIAHSYLPNSSGGDSDTRCLPFRLDDLPLDLRAGFGNWQRTSLIPDDPIEIETPLWNVEMVLLSGGKTIRDNVIYFIAVKPVEQRDGPKDTYRRIGCGNIYCDKTSYDYLCQRPYSDVYLI
jgi:hypothetical protein